MPSFGWKTDEEEVELALSNGNLETLRRMSREGRDVAGLVLKSGRLSAIVREISSNDGNLVTLTEKRLACLRYLVHELDVDPDRIRALHICAEAPGCLLSAALLGTHDEVRLELARADAARECLMALGLAGGVTSLCLTLAGLNENRLTLEPALARWTRLAMPPSAQWGGIVTLSRRLFPDSVSNTPLV